jgi:hypothetical protein
MNANIIEEAIANMASTSAALEKYCNDPKNYNTYGAQLLEQMSWELHKQACDLKEFQNRFGF